METSVRVLFSGIGFWFEVALDEEMLWQINDSIDDTNEFPQQKAQQDKQRTAICCWLISRSIFCLSSRWSDDGIAWMSLLQWWFMACSYDGALMMRFGLSLFACLDRLLLLLLMFEFDSR